MFANPNGQALFPPGLTVDASIFLNKAQCAGEVTLNNARIGGPLNCSEAVLATPTARH